MTRWQQRIGLEAMCKMLHSTIEMAVQSGAVQSSSLQRVTVDTTVQEKVIGYPTDSRLHQTALRALVRKARKLGVPLRQSHTRLAKSASFRAGR